MMYDAERGAFDVLVVWEFSRLSRRRGTQSVLAVVWQLQELGVDVHSVSERRTGVELADELSLLISGHAARTESEIKSKRVKSGKRRGLLAGVYQGAHAGYGYRRAGKRQNGNRTINVYEADPETAPVVREIVDMYVHEGLTPQAIADRLNERGVAPPEGSNQHRYARRAEAVWHQSTIRHMLGSPLIAGFATYRHERVKACECPAPEQCEHEWVRSSNVPALVDVELWERARRLLKQRGGKVGNRTGRGNRPDTSARFLLAGLVWFDECGERVGIRGKDDVYRCRGRRMNTCSLPPISREKLDEAVRASFVDQFVDSVDVQATLERERERLLQMRNMEAAMASDELKSARRELQQARKFEAKVQRDYEKGSLSDLVYNRTMEHISERLEAAESAITDAERKIAEVEGDMRTEDIDVLLDRINSIKRIVQGKLSADDVLPLHQQLREVFKEFRLSREGERMIVTPAVRADWQPEGDWDTLDFGEPTQSGVEVVDYLEPVMRKLDLTEGPQLL